MLLLLALAYSTAALSTPSSANYNRRTFLQHLPSAAIAVSTVALAPSHANAIPNVGGKPVFGSEDIMAPKAHGTSDAPVQSDLLYGVSNKLADRITNFNRRFAEQAGYFESTSLEDQVRTMAKKGEPLTFYDSVTGKALFVAPVGRSADQFLAESKIHGAYQKGVLLHTPARV